MVAQHDASGCKRLVAAVVNEAINEHFENATAMGHSTAMAMGAALWIMSEDERVYGCEWCCGIVGISADKLREKLAAGDIVRGRIALSSLTEVVAAKRKAEMDAKKLIRDSKKEAEKKVKPTAGRDRRGKI